MKNLENKEILSDEILNAISLIIKQTPNAVFGGSIALNAVGLINRPIHDIDLFFRMDESLSKNGYLSVETIGEIISDTITNTNGIEIQRIGAKIAGIKTCCFKVSDDELQCSKHKFVRNETEFTICIQNVNYAIEAKKSYESRNPKHKLDLDMISNELEGLVMFETENQEQHSGFDKVVRPVMNWLAKNCHPHMKIIIESNGAELVEGQKALSTNKYLVD